MTTKIDWCDETINPIIGCRKVSLGCENCYAEKMAARLQRMGTAGYAHAGDQHPVVSLGMWAGHSAFVPSALEKPYKWQKHKAIFVGSMGDIFAESVRFEWLDQVMGTVAANPQHTFIFLTKRPERMKLYIEGGCYERMMLGALYQLSAGTPVDAENWPLPNLVLGTSVENQEIADKRIPLLLATPAAKRFISLEPMIAPVDLMNLNGPGHCRYQCLSSVTGHRPGLDGVILGGESGGKARYLNSTWVKTIRDQCKAADVPFMFKQGSGENGNRTPGHWLNKRDGWPELEGEIHTALPWAVR